LFSAEVLNYFFSVVCGFLGACEAYLLLLLLSLGRPDTVDAMHIGQWYELKDRALASQPSPRIIVVGGSSALYGIDGARLSEATSWPVVNYATHAALPLDYHLDRALEVAEPGDILLLNLEFGMLARSEPNVVSTHFFLEQDPDYLLKQPLDEMAPWAFSADPSGIVRRLGWALLGGREKALDYAREETRKNMDAFGSYKANQAEKQVDYHRRTLRQASPIEAWLFPDFFAGVLANAEPVLAAFSHKAEKKDIRLIPIFPPIMEDPLYAEKADQFAESEELWIEFYESLGMVPLGRPSDAIYPRSAFFDSIKHLNAGAMREHTDRVAEKLRPMLPERPVTP